MMPIFVGIGPPHNMPKAARAAAAAQAPVVQPERNRISSGLRVIALGLYRVVVWFVISIR
jgi:hypothetical protein